MHARRNRKWLVWIAAALMAIGLWLALDHAGRSDGATRSGEYTVF